MNVNYLLRAKIKIMVLFPINTSFGKFLAKLCLYGMIEKQELKLFSV